MIFDRNQTEFKDCIQEKVWELATRQPPFERILPYADTLKSACADYYNFNQALLSDMYENPDRFGFEIDPSQPDWMNKKQVEFYFWFIGGLKNLTGNQYEMPADAFNKLIKKFNPKSIEALKAHGFVFEKKDNIVVIYNDVYPDMFVAAKAMIDVGYANYKVNCDYFMLYCDFRVLSKYRRTYEDLHIIFSDKRRQITEKIYDYSVGNKIMPQQCNYFFRVDYKYKGKVVYVTNVKDKNQYALHMGFAEIGSEAYKMIEREIKKYDDADEFKEFILRNFTECGNCRQECWKKSNPREIFGKKIIACSTDIRILDPNEQDLKYIFRLLELRLMVIRAGISDPYYPGSG